MKKLALAALLLCSVLSLRAQDFKVPLTNTFLAFDTTQDMQVKAEQGNKLLLIAKKFNNDWITQYYAAYSRAVLSFNDKEGEAKRDAYVDEAQTYYDEAVRLLGKPTDETEVLAALIAQARLSVKPMARFQKYGKEFDDHLEKAKELNKDNPRIYYLQGTSKRYTPKMFGGGKKAAEPYFRKAAELFAKQPADADMSATILWGTLQNAYFIRELSDGKDD